ncbi:hypothetical protein J6590_045000 [Homalodisca vitripennis]|nr:hypothetical protein J6590_045000 [Homalodisca vitripennis]
MRISLHLLIFSFFVANFGSLQTTRHQIPGVKSVADAAPSRKSAKRKVSNPAVPRRAAQLCSQLMEINIVYKSDTMPNAGKTRVHRRVDAKQNGEGNSRVTLDVLCGGVTPSCHFRVRETPEPELESVMPT